MKSNSSAEPIQTPRATPVKDSAATVSIFHVLRESKSRSGARPVAPVRIPEPASVFHVEHSAEPGPADAVAGGRLFAIERDELMTLRIRLIEEEHSAGDVARTLEAKLGDGRVDPLAARVLGEAYLRLGKSDQAAAQFRQAMLARSPRGTSGARERGAMSGGATAIQTDLGWSFRA